MPKVRKLKSKSKSHKRKTKRKVKYTTLTMVPQHVVKHHAKPTKKKSLLQKVGGFLKPYASKIGGAVGGFVGGPAGAKIGSGLGSIFGNGAYTVRENSILHGSQIPEFRGKRHETRIRHRGFIADISGTSAFTQVSASGYFINPGNATLFPWLSTIASQFEEYKFNGLVFEFRTMAGNVTNSTNNALGSVIMGTEYNATLPAYISKLQMENAEFSSSCVPVDSMLHPIECKRSETVIGELYVRNGGIPTGQDQRLYDLGLFQVATVGQQGTNKIGELWYSCDVSFFKEKFGLSAGAATVSTHYLATTGISTSHYFGTAQTQASGSNFALTFGATTVTFPANMPLGQYSLFYDVIGNSTALTGATVSFTTNCVALNMLEVDNTYAFDNSGLTGTTYGLVVYFSITGPSAVLTFSGATLPATATSMDFIVTQLNYALTT